MVLFDQSARVFLDKKDVIVCMFVCLFCFVFVRLSVRHFDAYSSEK